MRPGGRPARRDDAPGSGLPGRAASPGEATGRASRGAAGAAPGAGGRWAERPTIIRAFQGVVRG